jgi:hypothetical protein
MKRIAKRAQHTVRAVPPAVDRELRKRARAEGKSLNQALLDALRRGLGLDAAPPAHDDLDDLIGTWVEDPAFDAVLHAHDRIDEELWR